MKKRQAKKSATKRRGLSAEERHVVESLARMIVKEQSVGLVMQQLADELVRIFEFRLAVVTQFDHLKNGFRVLGIAPLRNPVLTVAKKLRIRFSEYLFPFQPEDSPAVKTLAQGKVWIGKDLTDVTGSTLPDRVIRSFQKLIGIRSLYSAPLMRGKKLIGTVFVASKAEEFSPDELSFLTTIAHHAALAVQQAGLLSDSKRKTEQYRLLSEADRNILEKKNLKDVLTAIVTNINTVIPCDLAGIYLYDPKRKVLYHSVASNQTAYALKLPHFEIPIDRGIMGHVAKTRLPMVVNHAEKDPRSIYPPGKRPKLEHLVCSPLIAEGRLLGVMHVGRFQDEPFHESDRDIVERFSEKSALAIENAQLFSQQLVRENELEALQRSGTRITETLDLNSVLHLILIEAMKTVPKADRGSIMLLDDSENELYVATSVGHDPMVKDRLRLPWGKGIGGYVVKTRKSIIIDDVAKSKLWVKESHQPAASVLSVAAVPLILKGRAIGTLNLDAATERKFTHHDISRLELFALHAALAINNAKLHASVRHEVKRVKLLRDIKDLARRGFSTKELLNVICKRIVNAYDYTLVAILLSSPDGKTLKIAAVSGVEGRLVPGDYEQSADVGIVGWVARHKEPRITQNTLDDEVFINVSNVSSKAELCVPILDPQGTLLGVINTESNRPFSFSETDLETHLAVALEIVGSIEEQKLLSALSESESKFRRLFEETKDAITVSAPDGKLTNVNQAAVDLFGFSSKEEMLRLRDETDLYVHPGDRKILMGEVEERGFLKDVELRMRKKDGDRILVEATITVLKNPGGIESYQAILRDITKQKESERKLFESEEKYRSLVEDSLVGVYIIQDDKFTFVNPRFTEIFGYKLNQIVDTLHVGDLVFPEDRGKVLENIRKRFSGEIKSLRYGFRGLKKNGETIEVEVFGSKSTFRGRGAVIGTLLDRTAEYRQQQEITEWRQRYDLIIASSGGMVYEYNILNGSILWSGSIEKVLGYRMKELRGDIQEWEDLIHPQDREEAVRKLEVAQKNLRPYDVEYRFRRKDGSFAWMHDRGFFLPDSAGRATKMLGLMEDVTTHKELEKRVSSSELRHRLLFEHANDAVFVMEGESFIDCNPRAMEMFDCRHEDIVGQTPYAFSPPHQVDGRESRAAALQHVGEALEGKPQRFTWRHIKHDGTPFEAEVRLNKFEMEGKAYLQAQVRDITAEVNAAEQLALSEEKYRRLILEAGEAILVTDGNGTIVEANEKACALLQCERSELLQRSVADIGDGPKEEMLAAYRTLYTQLISEEDVLVVERRFRRNDGSVFQGEMSTVLLGSGLLQSIVRDVTEKKQAEKELDRIYTVATSLFGMDLFEKGAVALAELLNLGHVIVGELDEEANAIRALTYYRDGEIVKDMSYELAGTPCEQLTVRREEYEISENVQSGFPNDQFLKDWHLESYFGTPMFSSSRKVLGLVCMMDTKPHSFTEHEKKIVSIVAQRMASEIEMLMQMKREENLSQQLLQSQKMESLGTLAGGIAHDFNNILGAIIGYTSLIKKQMEPSPQSDRYIEAIEKSAQRAASLTRQLLSFSHKTHGEIKPLSVNDLIGDTIHILGSSFPKNIKIETDLAPSSPGILGDQTLLGQAIMNLCINARDAITERGDGSKSGLLRITTSHFGAGAGFIDLHLSAAPGDYVCITVSDNGVGMAPELQRRIFEPFFTTKGKGKGTGLGLSMVYGIVRNHNGFIDVYSEPELGTTFKIFIPSAEEGERAEASQDAVVLPHGSGETIMIVEDEPMLRELVSDLLTGEGYRVLLASNGQEAVETYKKERENVRLVILDMIMPEMDGPATFRALRQLNPELKVLISSGFSQDSSVQKLLNSGAAGFVGKPYQTEDLLKAISQEIEQNHA